MKSLVFIIFNLLFVFYSWSEKKFGPTEGFHTLNETSQKISQPLIDLLSTEALAKKISTADEKKEKGCFVPASVWDESDALKKIENSFSETAESVQKKVKNNEDLSNIESPMVGFLQPKDIDKVIIHHYEGPDYWGPREARDLHVNGNGWSYIGYHYVIAKRTSDGSKVH